MSAGGAVEDSHGLDSVIGKVRAVLEAFGPDDVGVTLAELVRRTALPRATTHRVAQDLVTAGLLERETDGYRLGLRLFEIGQRVPRQRVLRETAMPFLEELFLFARETVHCAVRDGLQVMYVEKIGGIGQVGRPSRVAGRMPLHCTATGKALLAWSPPALVDDVIEAGLGRLTARTVASGLHLREQLDAALRSGFAVEQEEIRVGYASLAAPVFGPLDALVGAVSLTGPTARLSIPRLSPQLKAAAAAITAALVARAD